MSLALRFARRYLFAKKSTNAINIITGISIFGVSVGTAALILVMSVFNGFEDLITGLLSNFNPDIKVTPVSGKTFRADTVQLRELRALPGVAYVSQTLEEIAFFSYEKNQDFGILKGVDEYYNKVNKIDSTIVEGEYAFTRGNRATVVLGSGMRNKLAVSVEDYLEPMKVYMAKRERVGSLGKPFRERFAFPAGTFRFQQEFDEQYILASLEFARELLDYDDVVSQLEIMLTPGTDPAATQAQIAAILGSDYHVRDRYQQEEAFLKLMRLEKWIGFALLCLTLLLIAFNIVGALWMIVLEKKTDIAILKSMGATDKLVRNIFLSEGLLLCFLGMVIGMAIAVLLYFLQKQFGLVPIPVGFAVDSYPISMRPTDFFFVVLAVAVIALLASVLPAQRARRVKTLVNYE